MALRPQLRRYSALRTEQHERAAGKLVAQAQWCPESSVVSIVGDVDSGFIGAHCSDCSYRSRSGRCNEAIHFHSCDFKRTDFAAGCNKPTTLLLRCRPQRRRANRARGSTGDACAAADAPPNAPKNESPDPSRDRRTIIQARISRQAARSRLVALVRCSRGSGGRIEPLTVTAGASRLTAPAAAVKSAAQGARSWPARGSSLAATSTRSDCAARTAASRRPAPR